MPTTWSTAPEPATKEDAAPGAEASVGPSVLEEAARQLVAESAAHEAAEERIALLEARLEAGLRLPSRARLRGRMPRSR